MGRGIGYIDVHLLASAALDPPTQLWTVDHRLDSAAVDLGLAYNPWSWRDFGAKARQVRQAI